MLFDISVHARRLYAFNVAGPFTLPVGSLSVCGREYHFAPPGNSDGAWWTRTLLGDWLPALSADDPRLRGFLHAHGWPVP